MVQIRLFLKIPIGPNANGLDEQLRSSDRAIERSSDSAIERSSGAIERPSDRATERPSDRAIERPSDRATERSAKIMGGQYQIVRDSSRTHIPIYRGTLKCRGVSPAVLATALRQIASTSATKGSSCSKNTYTIRFHKFKKARTSSIIT